MVVSELSRLGRSVGQIIQIVDDLVTVGRDDAEARDGNARPCFEQSESYTTVPVTMPQSRPRAAPRACISPSRCSASPPSAPRCSRSVVLRHCAGPSAGDWSAWAIPADIALFTGFAAHHSVMARTAAKAWLTRLVPVHLERSLYVWTANLLFITVCWLWLPVPGITWPVEGPARVASTASRPRGSRSRWPAHACWTCSTWAACGRSWRPDAAASCGHTWPRAPSPAAARSVGCATRSTWAGC